jgi:hypothetical protein
MKSERAYLKKLAQNVVGEDEFYERELKFSKPKKSVPKVKKSKNNWEN